MKTIKKNHTYNFAYEGSTDKRVVKVDDVGPESFSGIDYTKESTTDPGIRRFRYDKVDFSSLTTVLHPKEFMLPNKPMDIAEVLGGLGILDKCSYDTKLNCYYVPKNLFVKG